MKRRVGALIFVMLVGTFSLLGVRAQHLIVGSGWTVGQTLHLADVADPWPPKITTRLG